MGVQKIQPRNIFRPSNRLPELKPIFLICFGKYQIITKSEEERDNAIVRLKKDGFKNIKVIKKVSI